MLVLHYKITEEEYKNFDRYTNWLSPGKRLRRIKYYTINSLTYIIVILFFFRIKEIPFTFDYLKIPVIIFLLFVMYLYARIEAYYVRRVKKLIKESGEDKIIPSMQLFIEDSGIICKTNLEEGKFSWQSIMKTIKVNNCYYLYLTSIQAIVVPKRIFSNREEIIEFEKMLTKHLPITAAFVKDSENIFQSNI